MSSVSSAVVWSAVDDKNSSVVSASDFARSRSAGSTFQASPSDAISARTAASPAPGPFAAISSSFATTASVDSPACPCALSTAKPTIRPSMTAFFWLIIAPWALASNFSWSDTSSPQASACSGRICFNIPTFPASLRISPRDAAISPATSAAVRVSKGLIRARARSAAFRCASASAGPFSSHNRVASAFAASLSPARIKASIAIAFVRNARSSPSSGALVCARATSTSPAPSQLIRCHHRVEKFIPPPWHQARPAGIRVAT